MGFRVGQVYRGMADESYRVEKVGSEEVQLNSLWYRQSLIRRWIRDGLLVKVTLDDDHESDDKAL